MAVPLPWQLVQWSASHQRISLSLIQPFRWFFQATGIVYILQYRPNENHFVGPSNQNQYQELEYSQFFQTSEFLDFIFEILSIMNSTCVSISGSTYGFHSPPRISIVPFPRRRCSVPVCYNHGSYSQCSSIDFLVSSFVLIYSNKQRTHPLNCCKMRT
jgi:hypothetical protein